MDDNAVMAVLKSSRKARKQTTCYPCQRRKVKCDRGLPCSVCVSRGHSFLCSYGRPTETSKTIATSFNLCYKDGSGSQSQNSESQMSALRDQLNHVQEELQHARKRHKQCEEAEDEVRRLQARCREYEDVHAKLRAGDWSALERINESVRGDSDTSSTGPDSSEYSQDAGSRDGNEFGVLVKTSSTSDVATITTTTMQRKAVSTAHPNESRSSAVTLSETQQINPPACSIQNIEKPLNLFDHSGFMLGPPSTYHRSGVIDGTTTYHYERSSKPALQYTVLNQPSYEYMLHQMTCSEVQQNRRTSIPGLSGNPQNVATYHSIASKFSLAESNQQQARVETLRPPGFISDSNMAASNPVSGRTDVPSGVSWAQYSLFPPMIFGQDQELMERRYADYWAKIVVEAQRPTLLAG